jgi:hypothetical protein
MPQVPTTYGIRRDGITNLVVANFGFNAGVLPGDDE